MFKFEREGDLKIFEMEDGLVPPQVIINGQHLTTEIVKTIKEMIKNESKGLNKIVMKLFYDDQVGYVQGKWKITLEKIED